MYPIWTVSFLMPPGESTLYKFVILSKDVMTGCRRRAFISVQGGISWEDKIANRDLCASRWGQNSGDNCAQPARQ